MAKIKEETYWAVYKLCVQTTRGQGTIKEKLDRDLKGEFPVNRTIYSSKEPAQISAINQRERLRHDREMSRCSYLYTERIVVKKCTLEGRPVIVPAEEWTAGEFWGMPKVADRF
jgi:hypothetical protein